ncbi:MAG TPA: Gfo/Idh/MocA family oxidoreductase [Candidatus Acidoferrales bacterium]|nr:Gfo/Idh/MocA family oxidoreductase [Candidatus Acidoferrales bacterium]
MQASLRTRREFFKTSALAAASTPFLGALSSCARADEPGRKLGFALAGLGGLSTDQIAPALQKTKFCRLTGIITGTPAKAEKWKAQYDIPDKNIYSYDTMDRMTDNPDIDVVYVVTPNALHAEHTIKAARAGKHVLCEKPMEVSVEKCQQMIDACRQAGRQLAIGYRLHFEPNNLECVRLAREKVFGRLQLIQADFGFKIGDPNQWRLNRALAGGGPLMDVGIYALQATRYLSGAEPVSVSAMTTVTDPVKFRDVEESISWQMIFPGGILASCNSTYNFSDMDRYRVFAESGWFELEPAYLYDGIRGRRSDGGAIHFKGIDQFAAEMDDFAQCILNHQPTRVPGEEGLRDVKIMMAIYEAARTGKTVNLA